MRKFFIRFALLIPSIKRVHDSTHEQAKIIQSQTETIKNLEETITWLTTNIQGQTEIIQDQAETIKNLEETLAWLTTSIQGQSEIIRDQSETVKNLEETLTLIIQEKESVALALAQAMQQHVTDLQEHKKQHKKASIHHRYLEFDHGDADEVKFGTSANIELAERIAQAYRASSKKNMVDGDGMWLALNQRKLDVHEALLAKDMHHLAELLANPESTYLFWGFDYTTRSVREIPIENIPHTHPAELHSMMLRLGEAWGISRLEWPESIWYFQKFPDRAELHQIIRGLEEMFRFNLDFPNPYTGERGLRFEKHGWERAEVISFRAIQSLHQALLIKDKLTKNLDESIRVAEIGAGLGRTAYYAYKFGITNFTVIDLPIANVAQAHYLASVLGCDAVTLYGEPDRPGTIRILPPHAFLEADIGRYELILNSDSLTEMDYSTMRAYWDKIKICATAFLSINHEFNMHTVRDLVHNDPAIKTYSRSEYWLRRGYVEEYITF